MRYISAKEAAIKWGLNTRTVQYFCSNGKIPGAKNLGKQWVIPFDAVRPTDRRTKLAKENADNSRYLFPMFIYSPSYAQRDSLNDVEKELLNTQLLAAGGNFAEAISSCRAILDGSLHSYIRFGAAITTALSAISLGNHYEYKYALSIAEKICIEETIYQEDYKFLLCALKYHIGLDHSIFSSIDVDKLSLNALPYFQYQSILCDLMSHVSHSEGTIDVFYAGCRQTAAEGIIPLEIMMELALANLSIMAFNHEKAETLISNACSLALENNLTGLLIKCYNFAPNLITKYVDASDPVLSKQLPEIARQRFDCWRVLNKLERGIAPFEAVASKDFALLFMINQGLPNSDLCEIMNLTSSELQKKIKSFYALFNVDSRKALRNYIRDNLSNWFIADN